MLRKHIKIEPEVFYNYCDRLGIVVFQDMVNNSDYSFLRDTVLPTIGIKKINDKRLHRDVATRAAFLSLMDKTVERLSFHPSVCYWTIFNEGWGQFCHAEAYDRLRALDDTRFVDSVSGWFVPKDKNEFASDVESIHVYFKPVTLGECRTDKPKVLSEFGGYSYKVKGHCFNLKQNYGYSSYKEWTASAYSTASNARVHDLNPEFPYVARKEDPNTLKRKVIKGGSWKDISYYLQCGVRTYEYQYEGRSYIGFRCVRSYMGQ